MNLSINKLNKKKHFLVAAALIFVMLFATLINATAAFAVNGGAGTKSNNFNGYTITADDTFVWLMDRNVKETVEPRIYDITNPQQEIQLSAPTIAKNTISRDYFYPTGGGAFVPGGSTISSTGRIAYQLSNGEKFQAGHTYRVEISSDNRSNNGLVFGVTTSNDPTIVCFTMPDTLVTFNADNSTNYWQSTFAADVQPIVTPFVKDGANNVSLGRMPYFNTNMPIKNVVLADGTKIPMPNGTDAGSPCYLPAEVLSELYFSIGNTPLKTWVTATDPTAEGYAPSSINTSLEKDIVRATAITPGTNISWPFAGGGAAPDFNWMPGTTYTLHIPALEFYNGKVSEAFTVNFTTCGTAYTGAPFTTVAEMRAFLVSQECAYPMHDISNVSATEGVVTWGDPTINALFAAPSGFNVYLSKDPYYDFSKLNTNLVTPENKTWIIAPKYGDGTDCYVRIAGVANGVEGSWTNYTKTSFNAPTYAVTFAAEPGVTGVAPTIENQREGQTFTLPGAGTLTKEGFAFVGWNDGTKTYFQDDTYTMLAQTVAFTAVWGAPITADLVGVDYIDAYTLRDNGFSLQISLNGATTTQALVDAHKIAVENITVQSGSAFAGMSFISNPAYDADCNLLKEAISNGTYTVSADGKNITVKCAACPGFKGYFDTDYLIYRNYDYKISLTLPKQIVADNGQNLVIAHPYTVREMKASLEIVDKDGNPSILTEYDIQNGTGKKIRVFLNVGNNANKHLQYPSKFDSYHKKAFTADLIGIDQYIVDAAGVPMPRTQDPRNGETSAREDENDNSQWKKVEDAWFAAEPMEFKDTALVSNGKKRNQKTTPQTTSYAYGRGGDVATMLTIPQIADFNIDTDLPIYGQLDYGFIGGTGGGGGSGGEYPFWGTDGRFSFTVYNGNGPADSAVSDTLAPNFAGTASTLPAYQSPKTTLLPVAVSQDRPFAANKTDNSFDLVVNVDENANVYYALYDYVTVGMTGADVVAHANGSLANGSVQVVPNMDYVANLSNLDKTKNWIVYAVAQDAAGNYSNVVEVKVNEVVPVVTKYNVVYDLNGATGVAVLGIPAMTGQTFTVASPVGMIAPSRHKFAGWNTQADGRGTAYQINDKVTMGNQVVKLYAMWKKIAGGSIGNIGDVTANTYKITATVGEGGTVSPTSAIVNSGENKEFTITANSGYTIADVLVDGASVGAVSTYTFKNVTAYHTIAVNFNKIDGSTMSFNDVKSTDWFYKAVQFVYEKGLMKGLDEKNFAPNDTSNRGMIVTMLYRLAGQPAVGSSSFNDVTAGAWYADAAAWAEANKIAKGLGNGDFNPNGMVSRQELACFMYNYAIAMKYDVKNSGKLPAFSDQSQIAAWSNEAMQWALSNGIMSGKGNGALDPTGQATRAELAIMLQRFMELYK